MQIQEVFDRRRFVFLDGGMGTQLQQRGLQPGQKPELAALEMPDVLTAIHRDYTAAGADILLANTFGANAKKLAGCGHSVEEVVSASIACARRAGQETSALVALDIGPLGELLAPAGTLAFEDAYEEFAQVIRAGAAAGAGAAALGADAASTGAFGAATPLRSRDLYASTFSTSTSYLFPLIVATYFIITFSSFHLRIAFTNSVLQELFLSQPYHHS